MKKKMLDETHPHLISEWHPTKNRDLTPNDVTHGSGRKVWWQCVKGHEWQSHIYNRTLRGDKCIYCSNKKVNEDNCLYTFNPALAREWHPTKNGNFQPSDITTGSGKKVWWKCDKGDDHEWETTVPSRINGSGCPFCSGHKATRINNLALSNPALAKQWHPTKNGDLTPYMVLPQSNKKVWWICVEGDDHEWETDVASRTNGNGCPFCSGQKVSKTNNLAHLYPVLVKEWHPNKNGTSKPSHVTVGSSKKVWWICEKGHEWQAHIYTRTKGSGCRKCKKNSSSYPEYAICYFLMKNDIAFEHRYLDKAGEIDIFLPTLNIAIEYNGEYYHKDRRKKDEEKFAKLAEKYHLILINENNLDGYEYLNNKPLEHKIIQFFHKESHKKNYDYITQIFSYLGIRSVIPIDGKQHKNILLTMQNLIVGKSVLQNERLLSQWHTEKNKGLNPSFFPVHSNEKIWWKCDKEDDHEWESTVANRTSGNGCPFCSGKKVSKTNNLEHLNPDLAKQWHPSKNNLLKPSDVTAGSYKNVWWNCEKGHEWEARISTRAKGVSCPFCSGHKASETNNLEHLNPKLAKQWHPNKNGHLQPTDITSKLDKKIWWICDKGEDHEWESTVGNRAKGNGCPFCSGKKVSKTNNLAHLYPALAKQWHPIKNGTLKPTDVTTGTNKKVWWKCDKEDDHEWEATIGSRTNGNGCPLCSGKKVSKTNNLAYLYPALAKQWHPIKNGTLKPTDVMPGSHKKTWWKCDVGHEWETYIYSRTGKSKSGCPTCHKQIRK